MLDAPNVGSILGALSGALRSDHGVFCRKFPEFSARSAWGWSVRVCRNAKFF